MVHILRTGRKLLLWLALRLLLRLVLMGLVGAGLAAVHLADPLDGRKLYIAGRYCLIEDLRYLLVAESDQDPDVIHITDRELVQISAKVDLLTTCFAKVSFGTLVRTASCVPHSKPKAKLTALTTGSAVIVDLWSIGEGQGRPSDHSGQKSGFMISDSSHSQEAG